MASTAVILSAAKDPCILHGAATTSKGHGFSRAINEQNDAGL
jgi:hypothetical protein